MPRQTMNAPLPVVWLCTTLPYGLHNTGDTIYLCFYDHSIVSCMQRYVREIMLSHFSCAENIHRYLLNTWTAVRVFRNGMRMRMPSTLDSVQIDMAICLLHVM